MWIFGDSDLDRLKELLDVLKSQIGLQYTSRSVLKRISDIEVLIEKMLQKGKKEKVAEALSIAKTEQVPITALGRTQEDAARNLAGMPKEVSPVAQGIWEDALKKFESKLL